MRAAIMGTSCQISVQDVETPVAENGQVLIKVAKAGICGSDKHSWKDGNSTGQIRGHEYSGTVVDPGSREDLKVGDRVAVITLNPCMECAYCKEGNTALCIGNSVFPGGGMPGAFAEYVLSRPDLVVKMDDRISFTEGALAEPVAVSYHAVQLAGVKRGNKVLINGSGALAAFAAQIARYLGAELIVCADRHDNYAKQLLTNGDADHYVKVDGPQFYAKVMELSDWAGYDCCIDTNGSAEDLEANLAAVKRGRPAVMLGLNAAEKQPLNTHEIIMCAWQVIGSYSYNIEEYHTVLELMAEKHINPSIYATKEFSLEDIQAAHEHSVDRTKSDLKVIISC